MPPPRRCHWTRRGRCVHVRHLCPCPTSGRVRAEGLYCLCLSACWISRWCAFSACRGIAVVAAPLHRRCHSDICTPRQHANTQKRTRYSAACGVAVGFDPTTFCLNGRRSPKDRGVLPHGRAAHCVGAQCLRHVLQRTAVTMHRREAHGLRTHGRGHAALRTSVECCHVQHITTTNGVWLSMLCCCSIATRKGQTPYTLCPLVCAPLIGEKEKERVTRVTPRRKLTLCWRSTPTTIHNKHSLHPF